METKVYLSGGMNEENWQANLISNVGKNGFAFFNPREHKLEHSREYTIWDLYYVKNCDFVFAYMEQNNPSGYGLTLEIGYASAIGKPIILVDEKSIHDANFKKYFKIVRESSSIVFDNLEDGIKFLKNIRNGIVTM
ncbi:MAG: nucleoside 2-deoxyribosyltransferase domain-containing protein [Chitinophagaceae bacterium]|nr:nucleoside 2-deoxyribosyltransferase domain-containing protein [Chitinophagaceae bacterium]